MDYKPNLDEVVERHRLLWSRQLSNGILAILDVEDAPYDPYNLPEKYKTTEMSPLAQSPDIERMFHAWDLCFSRRRHLRDDSLPVARMGLGGYEFGGILGGELVFSGYAPFLKGPLVKEWSDLDSLHLDKDNIWYQHRLEMCRYFAEHARGKFGCCEGDNITAGNLLELLRGSQAYLDILDNPAECRRTMARGVEWAGKLLVAQRLLLGDTRVYRGGSFHNFYIWLPDDAVWLSADFYCVCKASTYLQLGQVYDQQLIDKLGGGWVHTHSNGLHIIPDLVTLKGLKGLGVWEDQPPNPRPFERLQGIRKVTEDIPLMIRCRLEEFEAGLANGSLPGGICYEVFSLPSVAEANALMKRVYAYEPGRPV